MVTEAPANELRLRKLRSPSQVEGEFNKGLNNQTKASGVDCAMVTVRNPQNSIGSC